ncbi:MAG TPA: hypothetical protein DHN33_04500, partial [Eubacteriaceae bacterium]|nr:hypothetical protein [Eubacteriaceae bacterium]
RIYGVDPNCFKGNIDEILEQTHPQDRQKLQEAIDQGLKGKSFKTEYRIIRKDQTIRTVIAKAEPLYGKEGKVGGLIGTIQDITDYKALEQRLKKNLNLLTQVQALAKLGSWELDLTVEKGLTCSEETLKIYGISSEEWEYTYEGFLKRVYPQDKKIIDEIWEDIPKKPFEMEFRIVRSDGAVRNVHQRIEVIFNEKEEPVRAYGIIQDITEKKKLEEEIRQKQKEVQKVQKRFQVLIGKSNDVFEIIDREGIVRYVSEAVEKITGFKPEERIGRSIYSFFKQTNKNSLEYNIKRLLEHPDREMHGVVTPNLKTNEEKFLDVRMQNMLKEPAVEGIVLHYRDITRQLEMEERLAYLSTHDEWTQLPNRLYFKKEYKKLCDRAREDKTGFAILMLKVSGISYAVYSLGYDYGQFLFLKIVERLKTYLGEDYLIARYAEEHLAIIAQGFSRQEEYEKLVGQIIALFEAPFKIGDYELDVSVNIGVCIYSQSEKWDVEALKKQALAALLQARKEGKNTYKFFSADLDIAHYKEFTLRKDLRNALEEEQFSIHYQPIVNMKTNEILAAEALIRWEHPDWGLVPPHDFLHLAEETGIMIEIGYWVIRETCKSYRKWLDQGYPSIKIALNLSSVQFLEKEFVENLQAIVHEYDLDPKFF